MQVLLRRQNTALHRLGRLENTYMPVAKKLGLNLLFYILIFGAGAISSHLFQLAVSFFYIHTHSLVTYTPNCQCQGLNLFLTCVLSES